MLSAVFDAYQLRQLPEALVGQGEPLPMFCDQSHRVATTEEKARRVWAGLEKRLSREARRMLAVSYLSEDKALDTPLFHYVYKVFRQMERIERNFSDPDVLFVTNTARRVMHEALRMKQFVRFQKGRDGTYLGIVRPDHNVLPLAVDHFADRFQDQPWLLYDVRRRYGYYYDQREVTRVTFEDDASLPFDLRTGQLSADLLSADDQLFQHLWRTYFKAICIRERLNPRKQLNDMPRRYWAYMTEKQ